MVSTHSGRRSRCWSFGSPSAMTISTASPSYRNQTGDTAAVPSMRYVTSTAGEGSARRSIVSAGRFATVGFSLANKDIATGGRSERFGVAAPRFPGPGDRRSAWAFEEVTARPRTTSARIEDRRLPTPCVDDNVVMLTFQARGDHLG